MAKIYGNFIKRQNNSHEFPCITSFLIGNGWSGFVAFMVDTGADVTLIQPRHIQTLSAQSALKQAGRLGNGVGGNIQLAILKNTTISFKCNDGTTHAVKIDLYAAPSVYDDTLPALLGRDVLSLLGSTHYCPKIKQIYIDV